jgi:hypothetical protein
MAPQTTETKKRKAFFAFFKTHTFKIGGGGFAIGAILSLVSVNLFHTEPLIAVTPSSQKISMHEADSFATEYGQYLHRLRVRDTTTKTLEALRIDARQLDSMINHNHNSKKKNADGSWDTIADEVILYLGKNGGSGHHANLHLIAVGAQDIGTPEKPKYSLMIDRTKPYDTSASLIYDKTKPCPGSVGCPQNFQPTNQ